MKHCPGCDKDAPAQTFVVEPVVDLRPLGTFSLAGKTLKASARRRYRLSHATCGWSVLGRIEGSDFVVWPDD